MRELYEADLHKPGIYGSGRVWANVWDVFPRMPSRVGRGRRAAVAFAVCFGWGGFSCVLSMSLHFQNSYIQSSQRRLGEGAPTASQSAHRELALTYPHQVYRLVCSHLRNTSSMASSVDQYRRSRPRSVRSSSSFPTNFVKLRERHSSMLARQSTTADV